MTFKIKCDGCGEEVNAPIGALGNPFNPTGWYSRVHEGKMQHVCSRRCLEKIGGLVAPW